MQVFSKYSQTEILVINDKNEREKVAAELEKKDSSLRNLIQAYLDLAQKNQDPDFKNRSNFLKIFPLFFAENPPDFYEDERIRSLKKELLNINIKLNIFELPKTTQACFWYMFFNFMSPIKGEIEITTSRRAILSKKYCRKTNPNSRTLQNTFLHLTKSGMLIQVEKSKHKTIYAVPLISATRSFTESYVGLPGLVLELLHTAHMRAVSEHNEILDSEKLKQNLSEQMTDEFIKKMSYKNQNLKLKVTYELECNSESGELVFGDLIDVVDVKPHSPSIDNENDKRLGIIDKFLECGYKLKKEQINQLVNIDLESLAEKYKADPIHVKRIIKGTPTIGRTTYKNIVEFLSSY